MRKTSEILERFEKTCSIWLASLDGYSEHTFAMKPDDNSWSIGQVYNHLTNGTRKFQLKHIAACLEGRGAEGSKGKTLPGMIIFMLGSFPPARIKVLPSSEYTPAQPESIEVVRKDLVDLMATLQAVESKLDGVSEGQKTEHPRLGYLNAVEWFYLIEMHFRHHLRQKRRIDAFLASNAK
jgi:hypothetical protein